MYYHIPAPNRVEGEDGAKQLGSAGADDPRQSQDLALVQRQVDALPARRGEVAQLEHRLTDLVRHAREQLIEAPADHQLDDAPGAEVGDAAAADTLAVAQHREAVGHLLHLFEKMADV